MFVRRFNGTSDNLTCGLGTTPIAVQSQAWVFKRLDDAVNKVLFTGDAGADSSVSFNTGGLWRVTWGGGANVDGPWSVLSGDGWVLLAVNKATGTTTARFHMYNFGTHTWSHGDGSVAVGDGPVTSGAYTFCDFLGAIFLNADLLLHAIWATDPWASDVAAEGLVYGLGAWLQMAPSSVWPFNQPAETDTVYDLCANSADQTARSGTTVVSDATIDEFSMLAGSAGTVGYLRPNRLRPAAFSPGRAR